ncbi:AhpC/TSA family protein [Lutibacter sp. A80]|uniref:peroxiredoxin-like family protein n=1 Tax=Lutibacter sp. A80 TaxID=2918453 RepID=UPI001F057EF1|nr:peroxiredoxin-like family protein [Lutibacter sp. A80]UMB59279.1 AhpC/TSA family protein [Lutibacter sp. A80]
MKFIKIVMLSIFTIGIYACDNVKTNKTKTEDTKVMDKEQETSSLQAVLDERKNNFNKKADEKTKKIYKEGFEDVENSGVLQTAKKVGDLAPNFNLKNAIGETVELKDYLKKGPVVLTWYRGGWCPYCNITLHSLQEELPNFKAQGANLIALSPELPDESISTSEKHNLEFEVLSDLGNVIGKEYGVVFKLTDDVANIYNQKFDLNGHNGDTSNELPLAATYIINTDGKIVYSFVDFDYRKRAEPSVITKFLEEMEK